MYLASPGNQLQADAVRSQAVLLSYAGWLKNKPLMRWAPSFDRVLVDSGAFSELNSGLVVDQSAYIEWAQKIPWADNWAALDDISGDTDRTLRNSDRFGFPTFHDTDPLTELPSFIELACKRGGWLGLGMTPPRPIAREAWLREVCERIPEDIHVHGWALPKFGHVARLDSVDATTWWRVAMRLRTIGELSHLTYGETLEIVVKRYQREARMVIADDQLPLLAETRG